MGGYGARLVYRPLRVVIIRWKVLASDTDLPHPTHPLASTEGHVVFFLQMAKLINYINYHTVATTR